jgi:hypothetical protein
MALGAPICHAYLNTGEVLSTRARTPQAPLSSIGRGQKVPLNEEMANVGSQLLVELG